MLCKASKVHHSWDIKREKGVGRERERGRDAKGEGHML